jgi:centromeric protein E
MYGQTTSGKTFTMLGSPNSPGILPCTLNDIFILINKNLNYNENIDYNIYCSYIEIYNEKINDLLNNNSTNLKLIEDKNYGTIVSGSKRVKIKNFQEGIAIKDYGEENRKYRETLINEYSSRSHCIFQIYLEQFHLDENENITKSYYSCLNLIDLAGSERLSDNKKNVKYIGETNYINKSLFMLTNVINKLAENSSSLNKHTYIPYRDSILTRPLSQSLGGNSLTTIICTISPAQMNYYQTLSTLRFASRAKSIKLQIKTNEYLDKNNKIDYYQKEIQKLKEQLKNKNDILYNNINYKEATGNVSKYEYNKLLNENKYLNEELNNYKNLYLKEKEKTEKYKETIFKQEISNSSNSSFDFEKGLNETNYDNQNPRKTFIEFKLKSNENFQNGAQKRELITDNGNGKDE